MLNFPFFETITVNKIGHLLGRLPNFKTAGIVQISSKILKIASPIITASLTQIFNWAIILSSFRIHWEKARERLYSYKSGQRNLTDNYRPISVLPAIARLWNESCMINFMSI